MMNERMIYEILYSEEQIRYHFALYYHLDTFLSIDQYTRWPSGCSSSQEDDARKSKV